MNDGSEIELSTSEQTDRDLPAPDEATMDQWPSTILGGLPITVADIETTARGFMAWVRAHPASRPRRAFYSTSANGEVLSMTGKRADLLEEFLRADQILADGMPMVLYSRLFSRTALPERVATTDLIHAVARLAETEGASFYFLGGSDGVNKAAVDNFKRQYPRLRFVGRHHGYFNAEEEAAVIDEINAARPDILWLGMGVPLEQAFVARNRDRLTGVGIIKTSGGLFDFLSGRRARAPKFVQDLGFEWAYRAMLEPSRLGQRYLKTNGSALLRLIRSSH